MLGIVANKNDADLTSSNIKDGVDIFGVTGTFQGSGIIPAGSTLGNFNSSWTKYIDGVEAVLITKYYENASYISFFAQCSENISGSDECRMYLVLATIDKNNGELSLYRTALTTMDGIRPQSNDASTYYNTYEDENNIYYVTEKQFYSSYMNRYYQQIWVGTVNKTTLDIDIAVYQNTPSSSPLPDIEIFVLSTIGAGVTEYIDPSPAPTTFLWKKASVNTALIPYVGV